MSEILGLFMGVNGYDVLFSIPLFSGLIFSLYKEIEMLLN
jgi:hypothetical protein